MIDVDGKSSGRKSPYQHFELDFLIDGRVSCHLFSICETRLEVPYYAPSCFSFSLLGLLVGFYRQELTTKLPCLLPWTWMTALLILQDQGHIRDEKRFDKIFGKKRKIYENIRNVLIYIYIYIEL